MYMRRAGPDRVRGKIGPQFGLPQRKCRKWSSRLPSEELRSIFQQSFHREKELDGEERESIKKA
jgi:hypothetical protein